MKVARLPSSGLKTGHRSGGSAPVVVVFVVLIAAAIWAVFQIDSVSDLFGGGDSESLPSATTHKVNRESLRITVPGGSKILWIVEEGTYVKEGQKIVELDSAAIEVELATQEGVLARAVAAKVQADESVEAHTIAVQEYDEGTFVKEKQIVEANIKIAMRNLRAAENILEHSTRMARKGFATPLQVESDEFAVQRAQLELKAQQTVLDVLERFTRRKMLKELEAARDAAVALAKSEDSTVKLEQQKLDRLKKNLEQCTIHAPTGGLVIYANERSRYSSITIEEGVEVRKGQSIIHLPKLDDMQAKVLVNESKIDQLKKGMRAKLKILDREFEGVVEQIANQPERGSWGSDVKEYAAIVRIDGVTEGLKPGMTAEVEIEVAQVDDVLTVPVSAIVEQGKKHYLWVSTPDGAQRRPLRLGRTNDRVMAIEDGVGEGEVVILNPRTIISQAREENSDESGTETEKQSGSGNQETKSADGGTR